MRLGLVLLAGVVLLWGAGPVAIGIAVGDGGGFGPLWLNGSRLLCAGLILLTARALTGRSPSPGPALLPLVGLGLVGWSLGSGLQVIAQQHVASGLAALVLSLGPALTLLFDAAVARRAPALLHVIGAGVGLVGIGLIVSGGGLAAGAGIGVVLLLGAAASWAAAAVMQSRRPPRIGPGVSAAWQMIAGGAGLVLAALATSESLPAPSIPGIAAWFYLALGAGAVGFLGWVEVLRRVPVVAAMSQPTLSTVVAVSLGHLLLGEDLGPLAPTGILLAVLGAASTLIPRVVAARLLARAWSSLATPVPRALALPARIRAPRPIPRHARTGLLARGARRRAGGLDL